MIKPSLVLLCRQTFFNNILNKFIFLRLTLDIVEEQLQQKSRSVGGQEKNMTELVQESGQERAIITAYMSEMNRELSVFGSFLD